MSIRSPSAHGPPRGSPDLARRAPVDRDETLTDQAYRAIEEEIVTLALAPDELISEASLSSRLGIGRTPIREALQRLARERLVRILPRRGIVVAAVNVQEQLRLLEVRRELERFIARSAARRATAAQRDAFRNLAEGMDGAAAADDETTFLRLDRAFNLLLLEAAHNEFAASAMVLMHGLSRRFWFIHWRQSADLPLAARLHAAVARCVAAGDHGRSAEASDELLDYLEAFTRQAVDPDRHPARTFHAE